MIKISTCEKYRLCVDCDDEKCHHAGDKVADCPRYVSLCPLHMFGIDCENCKWLDDFIKEERKRYANQR